MRKGTALGADQAKFKLADVLKYLSHTLGMQYYLGAGNRKRKVALLSKLPVLKFRSYHPRFPIWRNYIEAEIEVFLKLRESGLS